MAMAVDTRHQSQFPSMGYDMKYHTQPTFTNPWGSSPVAAQGQLYPNSLAGSSISNDVHRYGAHQTNVNTSYNGTHLAAPSLATGMGSSSPSFKSEFGSHNVQDAMMPSRPFGTSYTSTAPTSGTTFTATAAPHYSSNPYGYQRDRRPSHPLQTSTEAERQQFSDALDASRGMVAMSQSDITPRNIYGGGANSNTARGTDAYGFPSAHSSHSSISSASTYPSYYNSSVSESSVGDYSSASESVDLPSSRTLPRPAALIGTGMPPAPQSMMGSFSSKISSGSQKKHKCKICDKRFTRPSSLQTHMYSHTGEKPFACDVEGCGRHFSVVSNLRRHRKVHKGDGADHTSPDDTD